jgi:hypothetical protein
LHTGASSIGAVAWQRSANRRRRCARRRIWWAGATTSAGENEAVVGRCAPTVGAWHKVGNVARRRVRQRGVYPRIAHGTRRRWAAPRHAEAAAVAVVAIVARTRRARIAVDRVRVRCGGSTVGAGSHSARRAACARRAAGIRKHRTCDGRAFPGAETPAIASCAIGFTGGAAHVAPRAATFVCRGRRRVAPARAQEECGKEKGAIQSPHVDLPNGHFAACVQRARLLSHLPPRMCQVVQNSFGRRSSPLQHSLNPSGRRAADTQIQRRPKDSRTAPGSQLRSRRALARSGARLRNGRPRGRLHRCIQSHNASSTFHRKGTHK